MKTPLTQNDAMDIARALCRHIPGHAVTICVCDKIVAALMKLDVASREQEREAQQANARCQSRGGGEQCIVYAGHEPEMAHRFRGTGWGSRS